VLKDINAAGAYSRKLWGLLSIELWYQAFHDPAHEQRRRVLAASA
jgi:asparagine synthase (glutamine-hydrolysing)